MRIDTAGSNNGGDYTAGKESQLVARTNLKDDTKNDQSMISNLNMHDMQNKQERREAREVSWTKT